MLPVSTVNNIKNLWNENSVEIGSPVIKGALENIVRGNGCTVVFDQEQHPFNFHTHPHDDRVPFSLYSVDDIRMMLYRASRDKRQRIDYLGTKDGVYSFRFSNELITLFRKDNRVGDIILNWYYYNVNPLMSPEWSPLFGFYKPFVSNEDGIEKILYTINGITGEEMVNIVVERAPSFLVDALVANSQQLANIQRLFFITFQRY